MALPRNYNPQPNMISASGFNILTTDCPPAPGPRSTGPYVIQWQNTATAVEIDITSLMATNQMQTAQGVLIENDYNISSLFVIMPTGEQLIIRPGYSALLPINYKTRGVMTFDIPWSGQTLLNFSSAMDLQTTITLLNFTPRPIMWKARKPQAQLQQATPDGTAPATMIDGLVMVTSTGQITSAANYPLATPTIAVPAPMRLKQIRGNIYAGMDGNTAHYPTAIGPVPIMVYLTNYNDLYPPFYGIGITKLASYLMLNAVLSPSILNYEFLYDNLEWDAISTTDDQYKTASPAINFGFINPTVKNSTIFPSSLNYTFNSVWEIEL